MSDAKKDAENLVEPQTPCACSQFYALENVRDVEETGDLTWDAEYTTGCEATTRKIFAPGHDAKLKGWLIKMAFLDVDIKRMDGALGISDSALGHARQYGFSVQVAAGIDRQTKILQERAAKAEAKAETLAVAGSKESVWTKHVMRNLQRSVGDASHEPIGGTFPMDSLEAYTRAAKAWLGDKTNLSADTIDKADYETAYEWFRATK